MDAAAAVGLPLAKPALCGVTRSKSKVFGSAVVDHQDEGEFTSPQRRKKFARTANFWTEG